MQDIAPSLLDFTPENQAATFRNVDRMLAVQRIAAGGAARPLPAALQPWAIRWFAQLAGAPADCF